MLGPWAPPRPLQRLLLGWRSLAPGPGTTGGWTRGARIRSDSALAATDGESGKASEKPLPRTETVRQSRLLRRPRQEDVSAGQPGHTVRPQLEGLQKPKPETKFCRLFME